MGQLTKMKIIAYKDPDFSSKVGEYDVLVNPEKYKMKNELKYESSHTIGSSAETKKFKNAGPQTFEIILFFDGTGIISSEKVDDQMSTVKQLVYTYNGDIHEPNYLRVYWGTQSLFQGRLTKWDVEFLMLDTDGSPLRSEVTMVLTSSISAKKKALEEKKNSADLTHLRTVLAGDNLPLMCYKIYGDSSYYLKVAAYNGITNFRDIQPGNVIAFPPVI